MTAFEVMGEHWFVTLFGIGSATICIARVANLYTEHLQAKARRLEGESRRLEEQRLLDMLDGSAGRLAHLRQTGAPLEELIPEQEYNHRLQVALGWRTDEFPPAVAELHASADELQDMVEQFARPYRTRARSAFVLMGSQDHPDGPSTAFVRGSDETSVDTLTESGAGSANDSTEPPNDPSDSPRKRRRSIRMPG